MIVRLFLIAIGGAIGSVCRYGFGGLITLEDIRVIKYRHSDKEK